MKCFAAKQSIDKTHDLRTATVITVRDGALTAVKTSRVSGHVSF